MKKYLILILLFFLFNNKQTNYKYYFPFVSFSLPNRGIAWLSGAGCNNMDDLDILNSYYFYHSSSYQCFANERAIPIVRPNTSTGSRFIDVKAVLPRNYDGYLLVLNEADRPDQDNKTPQQAVNFTITVNNWFYNAILVGPNHSSDLSNIWLVQYFDLLPDDVLDIYSFHIYSVGNNVSTRIDMFCEKIGECNKPIWITEMGYKLYYPNTYQTMLDRTIEANNDPRIEKVFAFTNHCVGCSYWDLLDINDGLTNTGKGWNDAIMIYP